MRGDLIETYKVITGKDRINSDTFFEADREGRRGHVEIEEAESEIQITTEFLFSMGN